MTRTIALLTDDELLQVAGGVDVEELDQSLAGEHVHQDDDRSDDHAQDSYTANVYDSDNS